MPSAALDLLSEIIVSGAYGRHETFHLRTGWLRKGYVAVKGEHGPQIFAQKHATDVLGVGRNMVNAIRYWCLACGILCRHSDLGKTAAGTTELGELIFGQGLGIDLGGWDPYLEDPATDWVLHYELVSNPHYAPTFFWAFNKLGSHEFNRDLFLNGFRSFYDRVETDRKSIPNKTLRNDYNVFLKTYGRDSGEKTGVKLDVLDSPFGHLGLMTQSNDRAQMRFKVGAKVDLPAEIVAWSIVRMLERQVEFLGGESTEVQAQSTINFDSLLWEEFSPGMIFKLDGDTLLGYIDEICERKLLGKALYDTQAGIRQLIIANAEPLQSLNILRSYYEDMA